MRLLRATSVLLALLMGAACADGMDDVNRVQPNYYDKSLFTGTWYMRQTVVDVPYEAFWLNEGLQNDLAKIRWEIQEKYLFAYSISENTPGANDPAAGAPSYQPVAAWPIVSHFDIIREYNPATGEQSNVIVENTSDRPWYERQYIRVDWSNSKTISEYTFDAGLMRLRLSGANHWIQPHEETDPDAAEISENYISIVNAFDAFISWWECALYFGDLSYYYYIDSAPTNCGPATVRIRTSFAKVDEEEEAAYEPFNYLDDAPLLAAHDVNGDQKVDENDVITHTISICSRYEGTSDDDAECVEAFPLPCTDEVLSRFRNATKADCEPANVDYMNKFPYFRTAKTVYNREYGEVEVGRRYLINRHNIWKRTRDENGNPIPYEEREVRPIVYYLNAEFPEDLYEAAEEIEAQWNEAFAQTVAILQGKSIEEVGQVFEVRKNSCSPENIRNYVAKNKKAQSIVKRVIGSLDNLDMHSNMRQLCAALEHNLGFEWQKIGDVRYNFIHWANKPTQRGLLGYGPSSANPDTGEIVSSGAYVYGGAVDRQAAMATDIVLLLTGRMSETDIMWGEQFVESFKRARQIKAENQEKRPSEAFFAEFDRRMAAYRDRPMERTTPSVAPGHFDAKLERLKALGVDKQFMDDGILSLLRPGFDPKNTSVDIEELKKEVSFFDLISPQKIEEREMAEIAKAKHGCMLEEDMVDGSIIGLALQFDGEGMSRDEIFQELRKQIFMGVMLHEIGHTLGLRHNFTGSMDPLNYFDEFWEYIQLPEDPVAAQSLVADEQVAYRLDRCVERAQKLGIPTPTTLECLRASELKQSSIMDYGAKFNSDFGGVGKYDRAAIAFGYGGLIEVFNNKDVVRNMEFPPETTSFLTHYTRLPDAYGGDPRNFLDREWVRYEDYQREKAYHMFMATRAFPQFAVVNGKIECVNNCIDWVDLAVPYQSCIDEHAGRSLKCHRWDEGASQEEVIDSIINDYESYYFLRAFRRGRHRWAADGYLGRLRSDLSRGTRMFQYYYFYNHRWQNLFNAGYQLDLVRDLQVASVKAFNHMARILQTPAEGWHCRTPQGHYQFYERWKPHEVCEMDATGEEPVESFRVPLGIGRPQWQLYTDSYPHYQIESLGTYYERLMALYALTLNQSIFLQESGDPRTFLIGFNKAFEEEVIKLLGSVAIGDLRAYAGYLEGGDPSSQTFVPDFRPKPVIDLETFGLAPVHTDPRPLIAAPFSYEGREAALLYGMVFLNDTRDAMTEFRDYFTLVVKGSEEDFEIPSWVREDDESQYLEFVNPYNGTTYRSFVHPRKPHLSFGMNALREAKRIYEEKWEPAQKAYDVAKEAWEQNPENADLYEAYLQADSELREADFDMNEQIELIDRIRFWYRVTKLGM